MNYTANLTSEQMMIVQSEVNAKRKTGTVAWLLWFFTGGVAGHRFYMGTPGSAFLLIFLNVITFGVACLIDAFFINRRLREYNERIELDAINKVKAMAN